MYTLAYVIPNVLSSGYELKVRTSNIPPLVGEEVCDPLLGTRYYVRRVQRNGLDSNILYVLLQPSPSSPFVTEEMEREVQNFILLAESEALRP